MSAGDDGGEGGSGGTIAGVIAAIVIVALGIWVVNEMADSARYSDCASSRRRNCDNIDYRRPPPPAQQ